MKESNRESYFCGTIKVVAGCFSLLVFAHPQFLEAEPSAATEAVSKSTSAEGIEAGAEEGEAKEEKEEKIVSGVVASYGTVEVSESIQVGTTGVDGEKSVSPLAASISNIDDRTCKITIRNSSQENSYSGVFNVVSKDVKGKSLARKTVTARLKPGKSSEKKIKCTRDGRVQVSLKSGKKLDG